MKYVELEKSRSENPPVGRRQEIFVTAKRTTFVLCPVSCIKVVVIFFVYF
jgi:hypothetical protein